MSEVLEGRCKGCGEAVLIKQDVRRHHYYHCQSCRETRFWYAGLKNCGDYIKPTIAKNGFLVAYCPKHQVKLFRLPRTDLWGKKIDESTILL